MIKHSCSSHQNVQLTIHRHTFPFDVDHNHTKKYDMPNLLQVSTKPALPRCSSAHSIDHYGPDQRCLKKEQLNTSVLSEELSQSCYKTKLRTLLYLEETARTDVLERYFTCVTHFL